MIGGDISSLLWPLFLSRLTWGRLEEGFLGCLSVSLIEEAWHGSRGGFTCAAASVEVLDVEEQQETAEGRHRGCGAAEQEGEAALTLDHLQGETTGDINGFHALQLSCYRGDGSWLRFQV